MKWNRRADLERDMVKYFDGAQLVTRDDVARWYRVHPKNKTLSAWLKACPKIGTRYPIYDLSEIIFKYYESKEKRKK